MQDPPVISLDQALERIATTHPEYSAGGFDTLSNHAPMAAEALTVMGEHAALDAYLDRVLPTLRPFEPLPARPLARADRLGAEIPVAIAAFEHDLAGGEWQAVVRSALPRLLPGAITGAFHGLLRVAHAVRALTDHDTPARRRELAHGLGYWAARFRRLPGEPGEAPESGFDMILALDRVPDTSEPAREVGLIIDRALLVNSEPGFASLVSRVDFSTHEWSTQIGRLARTSARLYLERPGNGFSYLHGVTSSSALRLLEPVMDERMRAAALGYVWQAIAAVHASGRPGPGSTEHPSVTTDRLPALAARTLDDHAIKLSEALLREYAIDPDPILMQAAAAELARAT
jgi:hypothetical protein